MRDEMQLTRAAAYLSLMDRLGHRGHMRALNVGQNCFASEIFTFSVVMSSLKTTAGSWCLPISFRIPSLAQAMHRAQSY